MRAKVVGRIVTEAPSSDLQSGESRPGTEIYGPDLQLSFAKMPSARFEGLIGSPQGVQQGASEEGPGRLVTANRYNDTAELASESRPAHLFRSLSSTSVRDGRHLCRARSGFLATYSTTVRSTLSSTVWTEFLCC